MGASPAAAAEVGVALPPTLTAQFDGDTLHVESVSFIDPKPKPSPHDILYSIGLRKSEQGVLACVVLEHQSTPDRMMAARFLS
ncbi:MAG: Rpn family recombination-promoting nuclease/putative transposase, partial [Deltaproteobacteria bacterium]|nr:Rpn family recombination-promoting nuclease/putative transposase [Deltaproteobacteria bacterium]